jgi:hypothetical protein
VYSLTVIPNVLASALNIAYNRSASITQWPAADAVFDQVILAVNGTFFPLGMLALWFALHPVVRGLNRARCGDRPDPIELARLRQRCLQLGTITASIGVVCWVVAGVLWPIILRAAAGPPPQGSGVYFHFLFSLVVCGLMAAAYPYFLVIYLSVTIFYPLLLDPSGFGPDHRSALRRVEREIGRYRAAATAVPLIAIVLLASQGASSPPAVAALSAAGLTGAALAFVLEGRTRTALAALIELPTEARAS